MALENTSFEVRSWGILCAWRDALSVQLPVVVLRYKRFWDQYVEKDEILDNGNEANISNGLAAKLFKQQPATNEHVETAEVKKVEWALLNAISFYENNSN